MFAQLPSGLFVPTAGMMPDDDAPAPPPTGLLLWLSPESSFVTLDTTPPYVASWIGRVNGRNFSQSNNVVQPQYTTGIKLTGDGNDTLILGPSTSPAGNPVILPSGGPFTVAAKFRCTTTTFPSAYGAICVLLQSLSGSTGVPFEMGILPSTGGYTKVSFTAGSSGNMVGFNPTIDTNPHTLIVTYAGGGASTVANYTAYWDGVAQTLSASGATLNSQDHSTLFGRISSSTGPYDLYGLNAWDHVLSASEITTELAYFDSLRTS